MVNLLLNFLIFGLTYLPDSFRQPHPLYALYSAHFFFFNPYNSYHPLFVCLSIAFLHYIASIMHVFITDSQHT